VALAGPPEAEACARAIAKGADASVSSPASVLGRFHP
jgi:hypothetical protein